MSFKRGSPEIVAEGGTGAQTLTSNGVLYGSGTSAIGSTAAGSTGQILMGNTSAAPSYTGSPSFSGTVTVGTGLTVTTGGANITGNVTVSSGYVSYPGSRIYITTATASNSASLTFTSGISGYSYYEAEILNILPANVNGQLEFQFSTDGGSTYITSNYQYVEYSVQDAGINSGAGSSSAAFIFITAGCLNTTNYGINGKMLLYNLNASQYGQIWQENSNFSGGGHENLVLSTGLNTATSINALKFLMNSGNITRGSIRLFGIV